ncbi:MAG: protein-disulfide reductase DsbD domain-containing protein [Bacteroidota bacterium]
MKKLLLLFVIVFACHGAFAQIEGHVTWAYAAKKVSATEAVVLLKADIDNNWHIYSASDQPGMAGLKTKFKFNPSKDYAPVGKITEPTPVSKYDKNLKVDITYFENSVLFQQKIKLTGKKATVKGSLEYITCNDRKCLPPETVEFAIQVSI